MYFYKYAEEKNRHALQDLAAGGAAGAISNYITGPFGTARDTINQVVRGGAKDAEKFERFYVKGTDKVKGLLGTMKQIYKDGVATGKRFGGLRELFRGQGGKMLITAPTMAVSYTLYNALKHHDNS